MREFGSDFHYQAPIKGSGKTIYDYFSSSNLYADGRQAIIHLYRSQGWGRLWVPEYFCYDVIESLKQAGLQLCFYEDYPGFTEISNALEAIHNKGYFRKTDAILKVNYFGSRSFRTPEKLPVAAMIEDHTHDLIGEWALYSQADWCIASLRKTLPIPEGGVLWSPIGLRLPDAPESSEANEDIAVVRWEAMRMKARYLEGDTVEKSAFRAKYVYTEPFFDTAEICSLDKTSKDYLQVFDIEAWYHAKRVNWGILKDIRKEGIRIIKPESYGCYPFSLIIVFDDVYERDRVRKKLIERQIYPAVLWRVPSLTESEAIKMSLGMLSIHCDGRYSQEDILQLKNIIESVL